jgi:hypothetical protein
MHEYVRGREDVSVLVSSRWCAIVKWKCSKQMIERPEIGSIQLSFVERGESVDLAKADPA